MNVCSYCNLFFDVKSSIFQPGIIAARQHYDLAV